ncbi:MAG: AAA family ATPase, partial [Austwickia sp.]|nr:AAA family ATPase [Austwickia sp.]
MRYLLGATPRHTVVLLAGMSLRFVGFATQLARALQPAIVVLEDCDLVAEDRGMHPGAKPLLFEVLDAMDGLAADADVTFLLTTNRVEAL